MRYEVTFTFGGCVTIDANSKELAAAFTAEKDDDELWRIAKDGFEIQSVEGAKK